MKCHDLGACAGDPTASGCGMWAGHGVVRMCDGPWTRERYPLQRSTAICSRTSKSVKSCCTVRSPRAVHPHITVLYPT